MGGIETFAMEVASTCMNVPSAKATAVSALVLPASAGAGATMAESALTGPRLLLNRGRDGRRGLGTSLAAEARRLFGLRACIVGDDRGDARVHRRIIGRTSLSGQGHVAHRARHERARHIVQIDAYGRGKPHAQRVRLELIRIQENTHRHALPDLNPVPRAV